MMDIRCIWCVVNNNNNNNTCLFPFPSQTWEYQALQLASSFQTLARGWLTFLEKAAKPVICFINAQSRYRGLMLFCCVTVCQIVTSWTVRHTQLLLYFLIFKPPSGSWLLRVKNNNNVHLIWHHTCSTFCILLVQYLEVRKIQHNTQFRDVWGGCYVCHSSWTRCSTSSSRPDIAITLSRHTNPHSHCTTARRLRRLSMAAAAEPYWDNTCAPSHIETTLLLLPSQLPRARSRPVPRRMPPTMHSSLHCVSIFN